MTTEDRQAKSVAELFDLTDRVALITGGSRGLGKAMAHGFARAGADVIVASRKADVCKAVADEIAQATGRRALGVGCHVGRWGELDSLVETVYAEFGRVDVLINNAGMSPLYPDPEAVTEALYDKVFQVNLKGPFRLTALVGARMVDAGTGSIINISSTGSIRPSGDIIPYSAAKAGLNAMTKAFADALKPNVRVNCIIPGGFATDVTKAWDMDAFEESLRTRIAVGRLGQPDEILGAALYLASDAASFTTGALLRVDGGVR